MLEKCCKYRDVFYVGLIIILLVMGYKGILPQSYTTTNKYEIIFSPDKDLSTKEFSYVDGWFSAFDSDLYLGDLEGKENIKAKVDVKQGYGKIELQCGDVKSKIICPTSD